MGQRVYWHNLTQGWFNENDCGDAVENSNKNDIIKFSVRGSALIFDLTKEDPGIESEFEFRHIREQFTEYYEDFHCVKFGSL